MLKNDAEGTFIEEDKKDNKMNKVWVIIFTLLVLLIPILCVYGIIKDRKDYSQTAVDSVANSWANTQNIQAPQMFFVKKNEKGEDTKQYLTLNDFNADIKINTEIRKKGIFKVPVYTADVKLFGDFKNEYGNLSNKQLTTSFAVSDARGFVSEPVFKINNQDAYTSHETEYTTSVPSQTKDIPFEITYSIRGLNDLFVVPQGQNNNIKISGNWENPSFEGDFLPVSKEVENKDFNAEWKVPGIATSKEIRTTSKFRSGNYETNVKAGVSLLVLVDNYRMVERVLKYAFLFLSLTFLSYFIFEVTSKDDRKIHPIQYLMLGGGMLIFYLLLLSMSEFMPFITAYVISALMIVSMITLYTYFVITKKEGLGFSTLIATIMVGLYSFLYVLLSLQDFALLIGSLGLFSVICAIMYITRNVDWYNK